MKIIVYFLVIFITTSNLFSDITYPLSIKSASKIDKGRLLFDNNKTIDNTTFYFISTNWLNRNETIYYWRGLSRNNSQGEGINNANILDAVWFNGAVRLIVQESNSIYVTSFDTNYLSNQYLLNENNYSANVKWISGEKHLFLLCNNVLNKVQFNTTEANVTPVSENVLACIPFTGREDYILAYLVDKNDVSLVYFLDYEGKSHYVCRIPITNQMNLFALRNYLLVMNSVSEQSDAFVSVIDINSKHLLTSDWCVVDINYISVDASNNYFFSIDYEHGNFSLKRTSAQNFDDKISVVLPNNLYSPLAISNVDNKICLLFSNAILLFDNKLHELLVDYYNFNDFAENKSNIAFNSFNNSELLIISSKNTATLLNIQNNRLWFVNKNIQLTYKFAVPIFLMLVSLFFYRKYRTQYRLLNAILELPSSGFVFFITKTGKLIRANQCGKQLLNFSGNIPRKKQFTSFCQTNETKQFVDLTKRGLIDKIAFEQKINILENNTPREWLCWLIPLHNSTGKFVGIVLTGIDITDALEKQMLNNWSQLAHDMQTNLSTIRLNTETINVDSDEDKQRKNRILYQISILVNRIRDIVTVGRDDKLELVLVNSTDFCYEIMSEFDVNIFSTIEFKQKISNFNFLCDKPKLLRAVRNAIENSIKYMKDKGGTVIISAEKDIHNVIISVKDTGKGMDKQVQNKIFTPYFSTARREGGHGIGTIIMQRAVELHGGRIIVESEKGIGTEIKFIIPDISRRSIK